jgi:hypothetical protein
MLPQPQTTQNKEPTTKNQQQRTNNKEPTTKNQQQRTNNKEHFSGKVLENCIESA